MNCFKLFLSFTLILVSNLALGVCQLNIRGEKICEDAKAVLLGKAPSLASVNSINYPNATIVANGQKLRVSVDELVPAQECLNDKKVCLNDRIKLQNNCEKKGRDEFKAEGVYGDNLIEVQIQGFIPFFGKSESFLIPSECVEEVI